VSLNNYSLSYFHLTYQTVVVTGACWAVSRSFHYSLVQRQNETLTHELEKTGLYQRRLKIENGWERGWAIGLHVLEDCIVRLMISEAKNSGHHSAFIFKAVDDSAACGVSKTKKKKKKKGKPVPFAEGGNTVEDESENIEGDFLSLSPAPAETGLSQRESSESALNFSAAGGTLSLMGDLINPTEVGSVPPSASAALPTSMQPKLSDNLVSSLPYYIRISDLEAENSQLKIELDAAHEEMARLRDSLESLQDQLAAVKGPATLLNGHENAPPRDTHQHIPRLYQNARARGYRGSFRGNGRGIGGADRINCGNCGVWGHQSSECTAGCRYCEGPHKSEDCETL
jgi:hypothetical protein